MVRLVALGRWAGDRGLSRGGNAGAASWSRADRTLIGMNIDHPWRRRRPADAGLGTPLPISPGTRLTAEGAPGCEFFVIQAGHVAVRRSGVEVAVLGPGDSFGEIVMLDPRARRTATVVAADDLRVKVFDRREFSTLLDRDPAFAERIRRLATERLLAA